MPCFAIVVAECLALRDGLAYDVHNGWSKKMIEGDSMLIIHCVNPAASIPRSIRLLVHDIILVRSLFEDVAFKKV
ncbi:unnamed protein product [Prunus armeniaca]|uniref:RNase H type-1 domain-containing protein n=1 Tax=Prunus armeniaca TaxID=36596 RepID=A0A6J5WGN9_PRUAR|nr:unnamed protein product [Prunus armeniaca]CAB4299561.1 unnamed protein product [Prunus armeniaca]